jgi:hypothetical protein
MEFPDFSLLMRACLTFPVKEQLSNKELITLEAEKVSHSPSACRENMEEAWKELRS